MGLTEEQGHEQEPRPLLAQFAAIFRELPGAIPGMLTPGWVVELAAKEERCRQHGAAVGLRGGRWASRLMRRRQVRTG